MDEKVHKTWSVHTVEYYSAVKRSGVWIHATNMDEPWKHCAEWKKSDTKGHIVHDSIHMKYPEQAYP